jgi:hypothetical protein
MSDWPFPKYAGSALLTTLWGCYEYYLVTLHSLVDQARSQVVRVNSHDPQHEGKLIVISGELSAANPTITDTDLQLEFAGLGVDREVHMYQWAKSQSRQDDRHVEVYTSSWHSFRLDDTLFSGSHKNPRWNPGLTSKSWTNESRITLGGFDISKTLANSIHLKRPVAPKDIDVKSQYEEHGLVCYKASNELYFSPTLKPNREYKTEVGDYRVRYSVIPDNCIVTVVGQQRGTEVVPWRGSLTSIAQGHLTNDEMLTREESGWGRWVLRVVFAGGLIASLGAKF